MNTSSLLIAGIVYFAFAYIVYGRVLEKIFRVDKSRKCPAERMADGIDYVKTNPMVLFGHHFASIAGAGPIVGPVLAAKYGWVPAVVWILLGCVFIGAMHDFAAMYLSVRHDGRSVAYVVEKELGYWGRQIFLVFCLVLLVLVVAVFTDQVANSFLNTPSVATSSILFIVLAPIMGCVLKNKLLDLLEASLIFVPLTFLCIWLGTLFPCDLPALLGVSVSQARIVWYLILLYYAFIASTIPVWFMLQPRDYLNSFLLYAMMIVGVAGVIAARATLTMPTIVIPEGGSVIPDVFPLLFVTIACGACSGFHSLVASGTSSKQIANEKDIRRVGYGGMLVEGVLAIIAICSVCYLSAENYATLASQTHNAAPTMFAMGVGHFAEALGIPSYIGSTFIVLTISAFILTSLDTGTRLARFLWQELVMPSEKMPAVNSADAPQRPIGRGRAFLGNRWTGTIAIIVLAFLMLCTGESVRMWPVFGAANQLLAAMTLLTVTLFLLRKRYPWLFAMLPMLFMWVVSVFALANLMQANWEKNKYLSCIAILLLVMAVILAVLAVKRLLNARKSGQDVPAP